MNQCNLVLFGIWQGRQNVTEHGRGIKIGQNVWLDLNFWFFCNMKKDGLMPTVHVYAYGAETLASVYFDDARLVCKAAFNEQQAH